MSLEIENIRNDRQRLVDLMAANNMPLIRDKTCRCPFHDDRNPSAGIWQRPDGSWAFHCHTCKIDEDVIGLQARLQNTTSRDLMRSLKAETVAADRKVFPSVEHVLRAMGGVEAGYKYTNPETGIVDLLVIRQRKANGAKTFKMARPVEGGAYELKAPDHPWPIYNRTRIRGAEVVVIVEGEKAVHALARLGIVATTSPGGAGKAKYADWRILAGKGILLWPDNDDTGFGHMRDVEIILRELGCEVKWVNVPLLELPPKGDAVEWIEAYGDGDTTDNKRAYEAMIVEPAVAEEPIRESVLWKRLEDIVEGRYQPVKWHWAYTDYYTTALLPGTIMVICGDPGSTKSFWLLEAMAYWHEQGIKVAIFELEEDRAYHQNRLLAQRAKDSNLNNPDWMRANPGKVTEAYRQHGPFVESFGRIITDAMDDEKSLDEIVDWIEGRLKAGCRVVAVDPISLVKAEPRPWEADLRFLMKAKTLMRQYGASLILVTHPRNANGKESHIDGLAGGRAYSRATQTIVWMKAIDEKDFDVKVVRCGQWFTDRLTANRLLRIGKARNGKGMGRDIAFYFDGRTLGFNELGAVAPKQRNEEAA